MTHQEVARTIQSYNRIAPDYLAHWRDRVVMARHVARFTGLLDAAWGEDRAGIRLADVGCGPGFDAALLRRQGFQVAGLELSWGMIQAGRIDYPGDLVQADMRRLPLAARLHGLWVNASFLHLPRAEAPGALAGFARVLRPGGVLYLAVKAGQGEEWKAESYGRPEPRFFTYWKPEEMDNLLAATGFHVIDGWQEQSSSTTTWLIRFGQKLTA
ncbi:MAG: class I SAM-dependent methyltransferase [Chloroflexi bacterium]|nr:class I SAM-dependent methyltransferase [Chloroflexota bacterium]MCI0577519.1 class I SAM-dependent methyltransferase [Chloroflexota bacterium]MCI0645642.1 class I SAM-dependent methyltransferase [Chloroflexota bacterium]MCI0725554.1 class I SAM-dependent methyltransferase [Chloroflexota bacterium]